MRTAFKKLFELLPHSDRWKMVALFGLMMIGTLLEVAGIGMLPVFVSAVSDPSFILENEIFGPIALTLGIETSRDLLIKGGIALVAIFLVKTLYLIWFNYVKSKFVLNRFALISSKLYENYLSAPYTFHLNRNSSELIRNVNFETRLVTNNVMMPFLTMSMNVVTVTGIFILLLTVEPIVTVVSFLVIGGGGGLLLKLIKNRLRVYGQSAKRERQRMIQAVNEGVGGYKDITVMNRKGLFLSRYKEYVSNLTTAEIFKSIAIYASKPLIEFIAVAGLVFIAFFMVLQGREISSIIPVMALFGGAVIRLTPSASHIFTELAKMKFYRNSLDTIYDDLRQLNVTTEKINIENYKKAKLPFESDIKLKNICFNYPNTDEKSLNNISLTIKKGQAVGFVGESGAGKSTIVDVILGLLVPQKGEIRVDGKDIQKNMREWQNSIGYIPQFIYLSDDTIRNNIAFGIPDDQINVKKIEKAVEAAQLGKVLKDLPEGLDTLIGEDGVRLSGGQRQRIGIARALYNNPDVLIMDEATSALDNITEKQVISAIEALKGKRTILMIAHRLTTVENCDQLYIMNEGQISETGTYNELIDRSTEFKKMSLLNE